VHWTVAGRYADLLQRVLDEFTSTTTAANAAGGGRGGEDKKEIPRSLAILADMRRCAVDLDALIERTPRVGSGSNTSGTAISSGNTAATVGGVGAGTSTTSNGLLGIGLTTTTGGSLTPARADLEFLDVFDFFNYPRLPAAFEGPVSTVASVGIVGASGTVGAHGQMVDSPAVGVGGFDGNGGGFASGTADWMS
jgi:hypothetical protein